MIFCHYYTLHSHGPLNAVSRRREFHGALIKVDDGIGCLHPWPEFGDVPVDEQLILLRDGGTSKVIERALHMAAVDGAARRRGESLFAELKIPLSHYSWDQNQPPETQMQRVIGEGWKANKGKGTSDLATTMKYLTELASLSSGHSLKLRIDFNSCLKQPEFIEILRAMPSSVREKLDFIEDPFPYGATAWKEAQNGFGISLACDKGLSAALHEETAECGYDVAVLKPGRRDWRKMIGSVPVKSRIVMTSAMDHAIGQSFAAYEAALACRELGDRMDLCGLCTEHLFARDEFFERLSSHGGNLQVDRSGTGLGFDEVLAELPWERL